MTKNLFALWGSLLIVLTFLGCGRSGPEIASVEGTVTMDGKPLPRASVVFVPEQGRPSGAMTDEEGRFVLNFTQGRRGAIPGKNKVKISTAADPSETRDGQPILATPEMVPMRYNAQTELVYDVARGTKNIARFELSSGGRIGASGEM
jgi:hypothetical protein